MLTTVSNAVIDTYPRIIIYHEYINQLLIEKFGGYRLRINEKEINGLRESATKLAEFLMILIKKSFSAVIASHYVGRSYLFF